MRTLFTLVLVALPSVALAAPSPTALVGPGVGSVELLVTQGLKDYNAGNYPAARDDFLKSLRASPDNAPVYLSLARSYLQTKQIALACWTYRVFLKASPNTPDREKAQAELENCQRQQAALSPVPADPGLAFVDQRATFEQTVNAGNLLGPGSASATLRQMLVDGYAAPDLAKMAQELRAAAETQANATYQKAVAHQPQEPAALRQGSELFQLALDVGATDAAYPPRAQFTSALADLQEHKWAEAEKGFSQSLGAGDDKESKFYAAVAAYRSGAHARALQMLERDLPDDPRTQLLRVDSEIAQDPKRGAQQLEQLLFERSFKAG